MSFSTLKYLIIQADTRILEFFLAVASIGWGVLLIGTRHTANPVFRHLIESSGGMIAWGSWSIVNGLVKLVAIVWRRAVLRVFVSISCALCWGVIGYVIVATHPSYYIGWICLFFAAGHLGVLTHRVATI